VNLTYVGHVRTNLQPLYVLVRQTINLCTLPRLSADRPDEKQFSKYALSDRTCGADYYAISLSLSLSFSLSFLFSIDSSVSTTIYRVACW